MSGARASLSTPGGWTTTRPRDYSVRGGEPVTSTRTASPDHALVWSASCPGCAVPSPSSAPRPIRARRRFRHCRVKTLSSQEGNLMITTMTSPPVPVVGDIGPEDDGVDAPFWAGLREHELRLQALRRLRHVGVAGQVELHGMPWHRTRGGRRHRLPAPSTPGPAHTTHFSRTWPTRCIRHRARRTRRCEAATAARHSRRRYPRSASATASSGYCRNPARSPAARRCCGGRKSRPMSPEQRRAAVVGIATTPWYRRGSAPIANSA